MKLGFLICLVVGLLCGCSSIISESPEQQYFEYAVWRQCNGNDKTFSGTLYFVLGSNSKLTYDLSITPAPDKHIYKVEFVLKAGDSITYFWGDKLKKRSFENIPVNLPALMSATQKIKDVPFYATAVCRIYFNSNNKHDGNIEVFFWDNKLQKNIDLAFSHGVCDGDTPICYMRKYAAFQKIQEGGMEN